MDIDNIINIEVAQFNDNLSLYPDINFYEIPFVLGYVKCRWKIWSYDHIYKIYLYKMTEQKISTNGKKLFAIIKPFEKYESYEFEKVFGFKNRCSDYNENKIVLIEYENGYNEGEGVY